jgi:hypothetical protein
MNNSGSLVGAMSVKDMLYKLSLDRLSICFNEPNKESVKKTCGLLISDHMNKCIPGMVATSNPRYEVSCKIPLPSDSQGLKSTVCFEAGPRSSGQSSFRIDFNPSKLSLAGLNEFFGYLGGWIDASEFLFFHGGKITRCDVALDSPGYRNENVIVRTPRLRKHGVYSDQWGNPETTYVGTPRGRRVVAYDKPFGLDTSLRLECRLKPGIKGHQLATLPNPFDGIELLPANFSDAAGLSIPAQYVADSFRIGGLKRALKPLGAAQKKALKGAYETAKSILPTLDSLWATWPGVLVACGLGKELGAIPVAIYETKAA